jgi:protein-L-isoaspartate(D-aspartate) O-methyltransferase
MWRSKRTPDTGRYTKERNRMVETQIASRGITDDQVLAVLRHVPRHCFVPQESVRYAYDDHPVQIGHGQTISQPYMVALMTEMLDLKPGDRVLEIGTGSGYQTAVLAELAAEVVSIERNESLAERARDCLEQLGYTNTTVLVGDGTLGHVDRAPYDGILVTAGGPSVPPSLKGQLAVGGRLVCPVGPRDIQRLITVIRTETGFEEKPGISCVFVPLIGQEGWESCPGWG